MRLLWVWELRCIGVARKGSIQGVQTGGQDNYGRLRHMEVRLSPPEDGWIMMDIHIGPPTPPLEIALSYYADPFDDLLAWLQTIAKNRLPASMRIDEEGHFKHLTVSAYPATGNDADEIELRIESQNDDSEQTPPCLLCYPLVRLARLQLLTAFEQELRRWLHDDYDIRSWLMLNAEQPVLPEYDLRNMDWAALFNLISDIEREREALKHSAAPIPPCSTPPKPTSSSYSDRTLD